MLLLGIDWADDHHDAAIMTESGELVDEFRFTHDQDGFDLLHARIDVHGLAPSAVAVAIETAHGLLIHDLHRSGYVIYALNPKAVERYKDRLRSTNRKDDKLDARTMANILRTDRHLHRPLVIRPDDYRLLDLLCRDLGTVTDDIVRAGNRLFESLKDWYPSVIGVFGHESAIFLDLLTKYRCPDDVKELTLKEFKAFLREHKYSAPSRAEAAYMRLTRLVPKSDSIAVAAGKTKVAALVAQLRVLYGARKDYQRQIKELLENLPEADIISSLPGVGPSLTPELTAIFGPNMKEAPHRYEQAKDLAALSGVAPVTKQSGKFSIALFRLACDRYMRNVMRQWAASSVNFSRWANAFYAWHRSRGEARETIYRKLAAKWIKIAFHLWRTGQLYDEAVHIRALLDRNVIWAATLAKP